MMNDEWFNSQFKAGELVQVRERFFRLKKENSLARDPLVGVVVDYWPSNVYESASYGVLVDGEVKNVEGKYLSRA